MSFKQTKESVDEGDVVILYFGPTNMHSIEVKRQIKNKKGELVDNTFQTTYGALKVIDLVGKEYGSKVQLTKGFGYVLQPTPELWTSTLPHRTQIIYTADISLIIHLLGLSPGSIVIESGKFAIKLIMKFIFYRNFIYSYRNGKWISFSRFNSHNSTQWSFVYI